MLAGIILAYAGYEGTVVSLVVASGRMPIAERVTVGTCAILALFEWIVGVAGVSVGALRLR